MGMKTKQNKTNKTRQKKSSFLSHINHKLTLTHFPNLMFFRQSDCALIPTFSPSLSLPLFLTLILFHFFHKADMVCFQQISAQLS